METFIDRTDMERKFSAVQLYVPWPNTDDFNRLDKEGRILDKDWSHYDNMHVVFQPKQMTVEELGVRVRGRDDCGHG